MHVFRWKLYSPDRSACAASAPARAGRWRPASRAGYSVAVATVILPLHLVNAIFQQARSSPQVEVCGLIAGKDGRPLRVIPIRNVSDQPQRLFAMDPAAQIDAQRTMREQGEELFGIYHSHPDSPAEPSGTDLQQAAYPEALYLIVSLQTPEPALRGYRVRDGRATPVELQIRH
jgi:proteasome lid subunit RPN8/RPN11